MLWCKFELNVFSTVSDLRQTAAGQHAESVKPLQVYQLIFAKPFTLECCQLFPRIAAPWSSQTDGSNHRISKCPVQSSVPNVHWAILCRQEAERVALEKWRQIDRKIWVSAEGLFQMRQVLLVLNVVQSPIILTVIKENQLPWRIDSKTLSGSDHDSRSCAALWSRNAGSTLKEDNHFLHWLWSHQGHWHPIILLHYSYLQSILRVPCIRIPRSIYGIVLVRSFGDRIHKTVQHGNRVFSP